MSDESRRAELVRAVSDLVAGEYGGDYRLCFDAHDLDGDGRIDRAELIDLLARAGVGGVFTRRAWAAGIVDEFDADHDGRVSWSEFEAKIAGASK